MRLFVALLFTAFSAVGQIRPFGLFTDHAVLQRDVPVPVWGTARPGETVTVITPAQTVRANADKAGRWLVRLKPQPAGTPFTLTISGSTSPALTLREVVYGDVWLCSGQSNMEFIVRDADNFAAERTAATDPLIRHVKLPNKTALTPQDTLSGRTSWEASSPETVGGFTAVGYFFARDIRKAQPAIPIGLLNSSWGGTRLECWASMAGNGYRSPADVSAYHQREENRRRLELEHHQGDIPDEDIGFVNGHTVFADPAYDDSHWKDLKLPSWFFGNAVELFDGNIWLRKAFTIKPEQVGADATLVLGHQSDLTHVWINGVAIDTVSTKPNQRQQYIIPAGVLRAGSNVVTLRMHDEGGAAGIWAGKPGDKTMVLQLKNESDVPLDGMWKYALTSFQYKPNEQYDTAPMLIYNAMIAPLHRFPIKGILWYQGESNSWPMPGIFNYRDQLRTMMTDWRQRWGLGDVPVIVTQLSSFGTLTDNPNKSSNWALLRESQAKGVKQLPSAALAVTLDVGNPADVHPTNKQTVGQRMALAARRLAYGENVTYQSPTYEGMRVEGNTVRLRFANAEGGLVAHDRYGYVRGFTVAGADKKFHWAAARVEGNEVVVHCPAVPKPVAVRYAWANSPVEANLFSKEGLPVGTFRTDEWELTF